MTATTQYSRNLFGAAEAHMLAAASANQLVQDQLRALDYEIRAAALKGNTQCEILSGLDSSTIKVLNAQAIELGVSMVQLLLGGKHEESINCANARGRPLCNDRLPLYYYG